MSKDDLYLHPGPTDQALAFPDFGQSASQIQAARNWTGDYSTLDDTDFVFSGFGSTGNTTIGFTGIDGNIRGGTNVIFRLDGGLGFRSRLYDQGSFYRDGAILAGTGDSGGLAGIVEQGQFYSYGTLKGGFGNSFAGTSTFHFNDRAFDTSVFQSRAVPEPSSAALLLLASLATALRRRSRINSVG